MKKAALAIIFVCSVTLLFLVTLLQPPLATAATTADGFQYSTADSEATITGYEGSLTYITIPAVINDGANTYTVTSIGANAFQNKGSITAVTIPLSVTSIGDFAFYSCTSLTEVILPVTLDSIGSRAFSECSSLTVVDIPNGVTSIGSWAFSYCSNLRNVSLSDSLTSLADYLFHDCYKLSNVTIPDGITSIGQNTFAFCYELTDITIPNNVSRIEYYAFRRCTGLEAVTIGISVNTINESAFTECSSLTEAIFLGNAPTMGSDVFAGAEASFTIRYMNSNAGFTDPWYGYPTEPLYNTVTYKGNGNNGGAVPVDSNTYMESAAVNVLGNTGSLVKTGYLFGGWNTAAAGNGITYYPGDTFTMGPADVTLYARWVTADPVIEDFVTRFYELCLSREPDAGGLAYWMSALVSQQETGASIAKNFIFSQEFIDQSVSDSTYLDIMYRTFFNRAADSQGKAYWQEQLDQGMSRMYILANFVNSSEFNTVCTTYGIDRGAINLTDPADLYPQITAFVNRFYVECLERRGDSGGLNYWVYQLVTGERTGADVADGFVGSPEFQARSLTNEQYLTIMYNAFFNRPADSGGLAFWEGKLNTGTSRREVLAGFVNSPEFIQLCSAYGIVPGTIDI